jgi:uncharacterized RmlC-like cupin family protein
MDCVVVKAGEPITSTDGVQRAPGISNASAGSGGICMQISRLPGGAIGKAHLHEDHESTLYILEGSTAMLYGEQLEHRLEAHPGDFVYIPASVPHKPWNLSETEPIAMVVARTDAREQESLVLLPHLDELPHVVEAAPKP